MRARVSATYLYPIKACAPLRVQSLTFEPTGSLRGDRAWVVIDTDDRITWQGAIPTLARIVPIETAGQLMISSVAGGSAVLPPIGTGVPRRVFSWNAGRQAFDEFDGHDAGDTVAELASTIAGKSVRLVHLATTAHKPNPAHLISVNSLGVLSGHVEHETNLLRFRPNIVLAGDEDELPPFSEEHATSLVCTTAEGPLVLTITAPCERCIVVNVDPDSCAVDGRFLKTVAAQSRGRGVSAPAAFGVYVRAAGSGSLAAGDCVELITARD